MATSCRWVRKCGLHTMHRNDQFLLHEEACLSVVQEPRQLRPPPRPEQELLASLNRRERAEIATRVLMSKKDAEDVLKRAVLRSRARERAKRCAPYRPSPLLSLDTALSEPPLPFLFPGKGMKLSGRRYLRVRRACPTGTVNGSCRSARVLPGSRRDPRAKVLCMVGHGAGEAGPVRRRRS